FFHAQETARRHANCQSNPRGEAAQAYFIANSSRAPIVCGLRSRERVKCGKYRRLAKALPRKRGADAYELQAAKASTRAAMGDLPAQPKTSRIDFLVLDGDLCCVAPGPKRFRR